MSRPSSMEFPAKGSPGSALAPTAAEPDYSGRIFAPAFKQSILDATEGLERAARDDRVEAEYEMTRDRLYRASGESRAAMGLGNSGHVEWSCRCRLRVSARGSGAAVPRPHHRASVARRCPAAPGSDRHPRHSERPDLSGPGADWGYVQVAGIRGGDLPGDGKTYSAVDDDERTNGRRTEKRRP